MTKIIPATCDNGIVKVGDIVIDEVTILSKGLGTSSGVLIIQDELTPIYIASVSADLERAIGDVIDGITSTAAAITKISSSLTSIAAGMTGPTTSPPPSLPADVIVLTQKVAELNATKADLQTLKGDLS